MIYETSFALNLRPFVAAPSVDRYFPAAGIDHARLSLTRCIERGEGPGMVAGPAGIGKTLLLEVLAEQFKNRLEPVRLTGGHLTSRRALLQVMLFELGLPYRGKEEAELRLELIEYLSRADRPANGILLLVDEAHNLPVRLLEEIRLVTNIIRGGEPRVHLVLAGGTALEEKLAHPKLDSLSQRLAVRSYLEPLNRTETAAYVAHQMSLAGGEWERVFSRESCEAMYRATAGIPRLINQVADHALLLAYADGLDGVDPALVERAWSELQQLPAPWVGSDTRPETIESVSSVVEFGQLPDEPAVEPPAAAEAAQTDMETPPTLVRAETTLADMERNMAELAELWQSPPETEQYAPAAFATESLEVDESLADRHGDRPFVDNVEQPDRHELRTAPDCRPDDSGEVGFDAVPLTAEELVVDRYARLDAYRSSLVEASAVCHTMAAATESIEDQELPAADAVPMAEEPTADPLVGMEVDLPLLDAIGSVPAQLWLDDSDRRQSSDDHHRSEDYQGSAAPLEFDRPSALIDDEAFSATESHVASSIADLPEVVVLEDPPGPPAVQPAADVRRQEYRQLFARLRRGS